MAVIRPSTSRGLQDLDFPRMLGHGSSQTPMAERLRGQLASDPSESKDKAIRDDRDARDDVSSSSRGSRASFSIAGIACCFVARAMSAVRPFGFRE